MKNDFRGNKQALPHKLCAVCGRTMTWRKAWAKNWAEVLTAPMPAAPGKSTAAQRHDRRTRGLQDRVRYGRQGSSGSSPAPWRDGQAGFLRRRVQETAFILRGEANITGFFGKLDQ